MHDNTIEGWEERFDKKLYWGGVDEDSSSLKYALMSWYKDMPELADNVVDEIKDFIKDLLATQNAEHQKLVLEEHALAKKQEQTRIVKILEGKKEKFSVVKQSPSQSSYTIDYKLYEESEAWGNYNAFEEAITLITK